MVWALLVISLLLASCGAPPDGAYTVTGSVDVTNAPAGSSVFVIASDTDNYQDLMDAPIDHILAMSMTEPDGDYTLDLTPSWAYAGDEIFLFAFAFPSYTGEMPMPDIGDYVGIYLKNDGSDPAFSLVLQAGETVADTSGDWEFQLIRTVRDYEKYLEFTLDTDINGTGTVLPGDRLFIVVVEDQGVSGGMIDDLNYVVAMEEQEFQSNPITVQFLDIIHENIASLEGSDVYLYVIHDTDGNGDISDADEVAAYNPLCIFGICTPRSFQVTADTVNTPPQNVEFINKTIGDI
jgi:hypothetical protein